MPEQKRQVLVDVPQAEDPQTVEVRDVARVVLELPERAALAAREPCEFWDGLIEVELLQIRALTEERELVGWCHVGRGLFEERETCE